MVQVGNEINAGMLWPDGSHLRLAQLPGCSSRGRGRATRPTPATKIVLHLAASETWPPWRLVHARRSDGVSFDVIGLSYYDYWHGRLDVLQTDLDGLARQVRQAGAGRGDRLPVDPNDRRPDASRRSTPPTELDPGYAATPAGQMANFRDVLSVVQAVPNGLGLGAFYWEPTWTVVSGNGGTRPTRASGDGWENQAMFNYSDMALP